MPKNYTEGLIKWMGNIRFVGTTESLQLKKNVVCFIKVIIRNFLLKSLVLKVKILPAFQNIMSLKLHFNIFTQQSPPWIWIKTAKM